MTVLLSQHPAYWKCRHAHHTQLLILILMTYSWCHFRIIIANNSSRVFIQLHALSSFPYSIFVQRDSPSSWRPHWKLVGPYVPICMGLLLHSVLFHFYDYSFLCQSYTFRLLCNPVNLLSAVTVHIVWGHSLKHEQHTSGHNPKEKFCSLSVTWAPYPGSAPAFSLIPLFVHVLWGCSSLGTLPGSVLASCFLSH